MSKITYLEVSIVSIQAVVSIVVVVVVSIWVESWGTLGASVGWGETKAWVSSNALGLSISLSLAQVVGSISAIGGVSITISIDRWVSIKSWGSLWASEGGWGSESRVDSNTLGLSLTLVELVECVVWNRGGHMLVAASSWAIGKNVWVIGIWSSNIWSCDIGEDTLGLSLTLVKLVDSIVWNRGGHMLVAASSWAIGIGRVTITITIVVVGICWVAISKCYLSISFRLSSDCGGKAKECNEKLHDDAKSYFGNQETISS
jgi:hypothetical protein